jgi:hypothetical protein
MGLLMGQIDLKRGPKLKRASPGTLAQSFVEKLFRIFVGRWAFVQKPSRCIVRGIKKSADEGRAVIW